MLLIVSYIFQYNYWNSSLVKDYSFCIRLSLGTIVELLPYSVVGITLSFLDIITKLKKYKRLASFYCIVITFLILKFDIFVRIEGFIYPGILLNIGAICIFILFSLFSFENSSLIFLLKIIIKFTGGIYYIHNITYSFLKNKFDFIQNMTFHGSLVIYIISYIVCYLGNKLACQSKFININKNIFLYIIQIITIFILFLFVIILNRK